MPTKAIGARITRFVIPERARMGSSVAIPAVKSKWFMKYGEHAYYSMNFRTLNGTLLTIKHLDIIRPGWDRLRKATGKNGQEISVFHPFGPRYHYEFNMLEQVMLMTVPHTATFIDGGRFLVSLWSWCGFLVVDPAKGEVIYHILDGADDETVLGSRQWFDPRTGDLYAMSYSLSDSMARIKDPCRPVDFRIFKHRLGDDGTETVWHGEFSDYTHDLLLDETRQYCVICELGMYQDADKEIIPSKVMIIDLKNGTRWELARFIVAAHAYFDPDDHHVVYFSNHNFEFLHSDLPTLLKKGSYSVKFRGPAAIYKYEITPDGPREIGVFTQDDFFRLTNMHVFNHRGSKLIAAMGFPNVIFIIDATDMSFIRQIKVSDPVSIKHFYSRRPALIGTIAPSPDGEKLFVQTTGSFQIIDVATGDSAYTRDYFFGHICFNHMAATSDTGGEAEKGTRP